MPSMVQCLFWVRPVTAPDRRSLDLTPPDEWWLLVVRPEFWDVVTATVEDDDIVVTSDTHVRAITARARAAAGRRLVVAILSAHIVIR